MAQVTLKDVARVAGVHFTTVSMALRGHQGLPEGTRERIRRIADRMGYVANPVYSALTQRRMNRNDVDRPRMAYLVNRPPELGFAELHHHRHLLAGATRQADRLGFDLELLFVDDGHHNSISLAAHLKRRGITGFVMSAFELGLAEFVLDWEKYAVIKIDCFHVEPAASIVTNDHEKIVRIAFQRMWQLGYRRIGLAVGRGDEIASNHRYTSGLLLEQSRIPKRLRIPPLYFPHNPHLDDVTRLMRSWASQHRVEAVICNWLNIREILDSIGLSVPDRVACACLCLGEPTKGVAGVVVHLAAVGAQAVTALARHLRGEWVGPQDFPTTTFVDVEWQEGPTAPDRKPPAK